MALTTSLYDVPVSVSTTGGLTGATVINPVGARIVVHGYVLVAAGAVSVTIKGGATNKSGAMPLAANTPLVVSGVSIDLGAAVGLILSLSAPVLVAGHALVEVVVGTADG